MLTHAHSIYANIMKGAFMSQLTLSGRAILFIFILTAMPVQALPANPLNGNYYGTIFLNTVGESAKPAVLGTFDLAFYLDMDQFGVVQGTSHVLLEKTLFYGMFDGQAVAPKVSGKVSTANFALESTFDNHVGSKTVTRSFRFYSSTVSNDGNTARGLYRETITGLDKTPVVVRGIFKLIKPASSKTAQSAAYFTPNPSGCIDLAAITAAGSDKTIVEYSDISQAFHLYKNPSLSPNLCIDSQQILNEALISYYSSLK